MFELASTITHGTRPGQRLASFLEFRMLRRRLGAAICGLLIVLGDAAVSTQLTFRAAANRVSLDVVVTDKDGRLVTDLAKHEFRIEERGKPQSIAEFELLTIGAANRRLEDYARVSLDVFSNAKPAPSSRAAVFILDDTSLAGEDIVPVKQVMSEFLRTLNDNDLAAVAYVRRSDLGQDFTSDFVRLSQSVNHLSSAIQFGRSVFRDNLLVLRNVIASLAAASQTRRFIVYLSHGFAPADISPASAAQTSRMMAMTNLTNGAFALKALAEVCEEARQRGIPIYTIDPRGLAPETTSNIGAINSPEARKAEQLLIRSQQNFLQSI